MDTATRIGMITGQTAQTAVNNHHQVTRPGLGSSSIPVIRPSLASACRSGITTDHLPRRMKIRSFAHPEDRTGVDGETLVSPVVAERKSTESS